MAWSTRCQPTNFRSVRSYTSRPLASSRAVFIKSSSNYRRSTASSNIDKEHEGTARTCRAGKRTAQIIIILPRTLARRAPEFSFPPTSRQTTADILHYKASVERRIRGRGGELFFSSATRCSISRGTSQCADTVRVVFLARRRPSPYQLIGAGVSFAFGFSCLPHGLWAG
jgi:hypothetical protein